MAKFPLPSPLIDTAENLASKPRATLPASMQKDYKIALNFLKQYQGNKATFEAYRREIERLLQWTGYIARKSVILLKRQDIENYLTFCLKPPKSWIAVKRVPRFVEQAGKRIPNPTWRPFVVTVSKYEHKKEVKPDKGNYHLSQKALQEIFTVLTSFYNYLVLEEKISINPVALIKQKSKYLQKQQKQAPVRRLSDQQWQRCLKMVKEMATHDPSKHERTLFILSAFYLLYLRISELVESDRWSPQMGHFYRDSQNRWWFKTVGKGNKMRDIAVSDDMLSALKRYRESQGFSSLPLPNEKIPLLSKEKGKGAITSTRHLRRLVQMCFDKAINHLRKERNYTEANALESATVHWLRHTGISDDINKRKRPIAHVRDDAGHRTSATTDRYNDIELKERHSSAKYKRLKSDY